MDESEKTAQQVMEVIQYAIDGDSDGVGRLMDEIAETADAARMYGVCCAFAQSGHMVLLKLYGPDAEGARWGMTPLPGAEQSPAELFALRFLTAYCSGDNAMTWALFKAALSASEDEFVDSVLCLVADVSRLVRIALDRKDAG